MTREEIIKALRPYFEVSELVCDHTFQKFGERSWQFLDTDLLHCLLIIRRDIIKMPLYCNSRTAHQRGLRCNRCQIVRSKTDVYLSPHCMGKALDLTCGVPSMTAEKMRRLIKDNANLLPCPIRLEAEVSWLHFDVLPQYGITQKVYEFKA